MGKITIGGKDITQPFEYMGKKVTKVTYQGKDLTFEPYVIRPDDTSTDKYFELNGTRTIFYLVTVFGNISNGTHNGFPIHGGGTTNAYNNMEALLGYPSSIFTRYAYHNGYTDERHWRDSSFSNIDLSAFKKYTSKEGEYLKVTLCMGSNKSQNNLFDLETTQTISYKDIYIRYHNGKTWQWKVGQTRNKKLIKNVEQDLIKNDWTDMTTGDTQLNKLKNNYGSIDTANMINVNTSSEFINFWFKFGYAVHIGWQGLSDFELHTFEEVK